MNEKVGFWLAYRNQELILNQGGSNLHVQTPKFYGNRKLYEQHFQTLKYTKLHSNKAKLNSLKGERIFKCWKWILPLSPCVFDFFLEIIIYCICKMYIYKPTVKMPQAEYIS